MAEMILVQPERCTGCRSCELVCSVHHTGTSDPHKARIHVITDKPEEPYLPLFCRQCEDAACTAVCPSQALGYSGRLRKVILKEKACIACGACVHACPFEAIRLDAERGKAEKCDLCGGDPLCVRNCYTEAISLVPIHEVNLRRKEKTNKVALRMLERIRARYAGQGSSAPRPSTVEGDPR